MALQSFGWFPRTLISLKRAFTQLHSELPLKQREPLQFVTGSAGFSKSLSKAQIFKQWSYGDDAYFIAKNTTADVIGVADGVGGWRNYGVDPSVFPRTLMDVCQRMVLEGRFNPSAPASMIADGYYELLQQKSPLIDLEMRKLLAHWVNFLQRFVTMYETWVHHFTPEAKQQSKQWKHPGAPLPKKAKTVPSAGKVMASVFWDAEGSSTACIVALHKEERRVYTANLGDSGFLIIRDDEVVHRSTEQQHYFNTPFQLSVAPPSQEGRVLSDSPDVAHSTSFGVEEGDIILLGSDGLFDNMNEDMLLDCISKLKDHRQETVQKTAHTIAEEAHTLSFDEDYLSPFALSAREAGINIRGGKPDDITVVIARVSCLTEI
ncbi:hypothetical protein FSP39_018193 [Pinctada imbricata]|uniref:Protein phosphatase n=1 Tax=Pinctada imbricata TaxID=66713 RepID=A0AA89BJK9_PINIB|nr:hypothetical protein FSP39_018193 [Pinctada imbricata]